MRKIIASIAAAGVLVAGAFIASTVTTSEASAQTDEAPQAVEQNARPQRGAILDGVLDDLVKDKTLTQGQADSVKDALVAKHDELKEKLGDRREKRLEMREQIEAWLEDGVITSDELAELDVDLPRFEDGPLAEALEDGPDLIRVEPEVDDIVAMMTVAHECHPVLLVSDAVDDGPRKSDAY